MRPPVAVTTESPAASTDEILYTHESEQEKQWEMGCYYGLNGFLIIFFTACGCSDNNSFDYINHIQVCQARLTCPALGHETLNLKYLIVVMLK